MDEIIREKAAGVPEKNSLLVSELAKSLGLRKKVLLELIRRSDILAVIEVTKKGGFLKLRTLVSHELRFASTEEMLLSLTHEDGSILNDAAYHPAGAARVMSVLTKMLANLPYAKKSRAEHVIFSPERPSGKELRTAVEEQKTEGPRRDGKNAEKMFRRKISPTIQLTGGRSVNTIESAIKALLEMKPGDVKKIVMNDELRPLFGDSTFGEMFASICNCTRARASIQETVSPEEIKRDVLGRLGRSLMEECIFRNITHPMIQKLHNQSKGQASKTLMQLRNLEDVFTPPALASDLFTLPKSIRPLVITTLGEMGDIRAVPSLAKILERSVEKDDRIAALTALIAIGSDGALASVEEAVGNDEKLMERARELGFEPDGDAEEESDLVIMD